MGVGKRWKHLSGILGPKMQKRIPMERSKVEKMDSSVLRGVRFGAWEVPHWGKEGLWNEQSNRSSYTPRGLKAQRILNANNCVSDFENQQRSTVAQHHSKRRDAIENKRRRGCLSCKEEEIQLGNQKSENKTIDHRNWKTNKYISNFETEQLNMGSRRFEPGKPET